MHSASHLLQLNCTKLSVAILSAMFCFTCTDSLAADPGADAAPAFSNPPLNAEAMGLKLDLGLAMSGDDCEDDYADLMHVVASSGSSAPAVDTPLPTGAGTGEALLAKLAPVESFTASAAPDAAPRLAQTAPMAKPAAMAAPVAAVAVTPVAPAAPSWEIVPADKTLNSALARWAAAAGWQLLWELPVDYAVDVRTEIRGSFEEAVGLVAKSMESAEIPMKAIFYEGNRVLRIVAKGAE